MVESAWASIGYYLHYLVPDIRKITRRLERLDLKILKKKQSAVFDQTCLDTDLLPKYVVYIIVSVSIIVHIFVCTYVCVCISLCVCPYFSVYLCIYVNFSVYVYICMCSCEYTFWCVFVYVHVYLSVFAFEYIPFGM